MEEKPQDADFYPPAEDYGITPPARSSREAAAWYYTVNGNREGPVPFSFIRDRAKSGSLNPRHDMVWTKGMADWKASGDIEGLFERVALPVPTAEAVAAAESPYIPPELLMETGTSRREVWPGTNRGTYLFILFLFPLLFTAGLSAALPYLQKNISASALQAIQLTGAVLPIVLAFFATIGRFANVGMSRWWILGNLIPILNIWLGYRCFACPAGYVQNKKLDGAGIFLAIIYWGLVILGVLVIVGLVLVAMGNAGDPEMQQKLKDILEQAQKTLQHTPPLPKP